MMIDMLTFTVLLYHLPQRPGRPPLAPPLGAPRGGVPLPAICWPPLSFWPPRPPRGWPRWLPDPRWFAGSCPDSHSGGGGTGFGAGGAAGCGAFAAGEGLARTGITDSSLARFVAGSCDSLPPVMAFISFVAATLVAFEVRWTPSPAQMLVPSTVERVVRFNKQKRASKLLPYQWEWSVATGQPVLALWVPPPVPKSATLKVLLLLNLQVP